MITPDWQIGLEETDQMKWSITERLAQSMWLHHSPLARWNLLEIGLSDPTCSSSNADPILIHNTDYNEDDATVEGRVFQRQSGVRAAQIR